MPDIISRINVKYPTALNITRRQEMHFLATTTYSIVVATQTKKDTKHITPDILTNGEYEAYIESSLGSGELYSGRYPSTSPACR